MDHKLILKSKRSGEAKSANEQQDAPSKKACSTKIEIVISRTIQHSATNAVSTISKFRKSTDVTQLFQRKP